VVTVDDDPNRIEFLGEKFRLAESIGLMPMLAFANASKAGLDSDDMAGLSGDVRADPGRDRPAATAEDRPRAPVSRSIDATGEPEWDGPSEWMRFEKHAIERAGRRRGAHGVRRQGRWPRYPPALASGASAPRLRRRELGEIEGLLVLAGHAPRGGWAGPGRKDLGR
jgi:hypothetical protein